MILRTQNQFFAKSIKPYKWRDLHDQLSDFEKGLEEKDYSFLYNNEEIISCLELVNQNCQTLEPALLEKCKRIIDLIQNKVGSVRYSRDIYKRLFEVTKKLAATLFHTSKQITYIGEEQTWIDEEYTDELFRLFIKEQQNRTRRQMPFMLQFKNSKKKMPLSSVISIMEEFFTPEWSQIFERTEREIEQFLCQEYPQDNPHIQRIMKKRAYNESFWKHEGMNLKCLGCIPYFIENWNVLNLNTNKTKLAIVESIMCLLIDSEKKYKIENDIKSEISGFLNTTGGIILFDCQRSYLNIIPRGQELVVSEVREIRKELERIISEISPQPKIDENIFIQFVPLVKDPLEDFDIKTKTSRASEQIPSQVVTRIIVRPTRSNVEYRYPVKQQIKSFRSNSKNVKISHYEKSYRYKSIHYGPDFISKVKVDEMADDENPRNYSIYHSILDKPHTSFDHERCVPCAKLIFKEKKIEISELQKYKNKTMLEGQQYNLPELKKKLNKYIRNFGLEAPFSHLKNLKDSSNKAILYSNTKENWIPAIFSDNKEFYIDSRQVQPIPITNCLKLIDRVNQQLPEKLFNSMKSWVKEHFQIQGISVRKQIHPDLKGDDEYFLKCVNWNGMVNKTGNFLLHLLLNEIHQNVEFCDPTGQVRFQPITLPYGRINNRIRIQ